MFTIFLNKAKTLLDVHALSLHHSNQKKNIFDHNKMKWEMVLSNVKVDFNSTISRLKQNELKLAEAQASAAAWQNKAILALSQGLIELAKNAFVHKSYYDSYIQELLMEKEFLVDKVNLKKAELYKVKFRANYVKKKSNPKLGSSKTIKSFAYKPVMFSSDSDIKKCRNAKNGNPLASILDYSHILYQFDR